MQYKPFQEQQVKKIFDSYPQPIKQKLLELRELIFQVASKTNGVGSIQETLRWNQPSYLTKNPKSGTTIRIDVFDIDKGQYALFVHCQTSLIEAYKLRFPELTYQGKRAIIFDQKNLSPKSK